MQFSGHCNNETMSAQHPAARWVNEFVVATTIAPEFDADGEPTDTCACEVEGILSVVYVESLGYWNFTVAGHGVDPETVRPI